MSPFTTVSGKGQSFSVRKATYQLFMAPKRPSSKKTKVRRTVVNLALKEMLLALDPLDSQASLEQQVLVSSRVSPESFDGLTNKGDGAVLLRFVRPYEFSAWQLDENQFLIIEDE